MRRLAIAATTLVAFALPAQARTHHHHHRHVAVHHHHRHYARHGGGGGDYHGTYRCAGCVLRDTLAGVVSVSAANAERFVGLINDLVTAGFKGPIHCAAPYGTHIANSRHHTGNACDFAQTGRDRTVPFMRTTSAAAIIARHGFTNGCSFRDCGHVGTDGQGGTRLAAHRRVHYARHRRTHYAAG